MNIKREIAWVLKLLQGWKQKQKKGNNQQKIHTIKQIFHQQ